MLKRLLLGLFMLLLTLVPIRAMAQRGHGGKWWHNPKTAGQLNLTDREKDQLDRQYTESRRRLIDLKNKVEREQFELETLLEGKDLDEKKIREQRQRLEKSRTELADEQFRFILKSRKLLGDDRFKQLKSLSDKEDYKKDKKGR